MDIDPETARALGFPSPAYTAVERERRWLCHEVPRGLILQSEVITDLYVTGSRLRLREARMIGSGMAKLRLSRKADVDTRTRLITSIYLPEEEFALLSAALSGVRLRKLRHRLQSPPGVLMSLDEFQDALAGLVVVEAEFASDDLMAGFSAPAFASQEVTEDRRFSGASLALHGLPRELRHGARPSAA
ncbi:MAG: hypothetical protein U1E60_09990 [Reyranellaceae bacterium]